MDWLISALEQHHGSSAHTEEIAPSSPSASASDAPGFALRRRHAVRVASVAAQASGLLPPQLRFPESRAYWTV